MSSAYVATLPNDIILDTGVLSVGGVPMGVTIGGCKFDPGMTWRNVEFDGKRAAIQGLDRIVSWAPTITGKILQFATSSLTNNIMMGSTLTTGGTPVSSSIVDYSGSVLLPLSEYMSNVQLKWQRGVSGFVSVVFPSAMCVKWDVNGTDKAEGQVSFTFEARQIATGSLGTDQPPYSILYTIT